MKEVRGYRKLKQEALEHTLWRIHFGRGYGPVIGDYIMNVSQAGYVVHTVSYQICIRG
jgi:hypothetical protein